MRQKKPFTIVERAAILVPEFQGVSKRISDQVSEDEANEIIQ